MRRQSEAIWRRRPDIISYTANGRKLERVVASLTTGPG